eukprot:3216937-Ditylum_brightwellii.AAC.1
MKALNEVGMLSINQECREQEHEFGLVGAADGNQFHHTGQLKVMTYDEAMNTPEKEEWDAS